MFTRSPYPVVAFAQFTNVEKMQKFVRMQKRNANMQRHKLWASVNKPAGERRRSKVASKIKKFAIELDGIAPRAVMVNYKTYKVSIRVGQKLVHAAHVEEDGIVQWASGDCPVSSQVQMAVDDFVADFE